ncbi:MAG: TolC family protein [Proteobacteria bacterium]|nr:TolC family protein [Pseudomonadota bacterium]
MRFLVVLAAVAPVLLSGLAHADEPYVPPAFLTVTPPLPAGADLASVLRLDLAEALRLAVLQNLDISLERHALAIASLGIDAAHGSFEPTVTASYSHAGARTPPSVNLEGDPGTLLETTNDSWALGASQRFSTGTRLDVDFGNGRAKTTANSAIEPLNYRSFLSLRVTQPILRGFSPDLAIPRLEILRAELGSARERSRLVVAIAELVERTESAYWQLLGAIYRYDLAKRSLGLAEDQKALTQRQVDNGTLAPSDLIGAESTLAGRQLAMLQEEEAIERATDALRGILNLPRAQWRRPILPTEIPTFAPVHQEVEAAFAQAMKARPELADLALAVNEAALAERSTDNATLPQLDLGVEATATGQDSGYPAALGQLGTVEARGWSVMANFSWTPLQRATEAAAAIARIRTTVVAGQKDQLVQKVWLEVREAVRNGDSAERQVKAAATFRVLAEKSLEIEQRKFMNGTSQNIQVAQRQEEVANARLAELTALLAQKRSTASLLKATGQLLDQRHIELGLRHP